MQKGHNLQFHCLSCNQPVKFSIFELEKDEKPISCNQCDKKYAFNDEVLLRQLKHFTALCRQIHESQEILGECSVGIDVGEHHVKVPYKILLTRFNSILDLKVGEQPISIQFRLEPIQDGAIR